MEISIEELTALTDSTTQLHLRIAENESLLKEKSVELEAKDKDVERLEKEKADLLNHIRSLTIQNSMLRNILYLSVERIKEFMKHVPSFDRWAFLRTFVEWTLPEDGRQEQLALVDEAMSLPQPLSPSVLMQNPTFEGPMYDVSGNDHVSIGGKGDGKEDE